MDWKKGIRKCVEVPRSLTRRSLTRRSLTSHPLLMPLLTRCLTSQPLCRCPADKMPDSQPSADAPAVKRRFVMVDGVKHYLKKVRNVLPPSTTPKRATPHPMMSLLLVPLLFAEGVAL
jgi:hypothetical protein